MPTRINPVQGLEDLLTLDHCLTNTSLDVYANNRNAIMKTYTRWISDTRLKFNEAEVMRLTLAKELLDKAGQNTEYLTYWLESQ